MSQLIDAATYTALRALEVSGMNETCTIARDGATVANDVPCTVIPASGYGVTAAVAGLGGGRASHVGYLPYGTDVADGDVLTVGARAFAIEGVGLLDTCTGLALSERGRG